MSHRIVMHGNATPTARLMRNLSHGISQLACGSKKHHRDSTKTYYLLKTGSIIGLREWHKQNEPDYLVIGSLDGCQGTKERFNL